MYCILGIEIIIYLQISKAFFEVLVKSVLDFTDKDNFPIH